MKLNFWIEPSLSIGFLTPSVKPDADQGKNGYVISRLTSLGKMDRYWADLGRRQRGRGHSFPGRICYSPVKSAVSWQPPDTASLRSISTFKPRPRSSWAASSQWLRTVGVKGSPCCGSSALTWPRLCQSCTPARGSLEQFGFLPYISQNITL